MTVSLLIEVPEALHEALTDFLTVRSDYSQDQIFTMAVSLFLLQNRTELNGGERQAARVYLDAMFKRGEHNADAT